jgi:hypothetical protein
MIGRILALRRSGAAQAGDRDGELAARQHRRR